MCLIFCKNFTSPQQIFSKSAVQRKYIMLYRGITLFWCPISYSCGYKQSKLRRLSQYVDHNSSLLQFSCFSTSHPIISKILMILPVQYCCLPPFFFNFQDHNPSSSCYLNPMKWILPKAIERHAWLPLIQMYLPEAEPTMLLLCLNIFSWLFNASVVRQIPKFPRFHYRNLINLKEEGFWASEALNLKFCSPTNQPGNHLTYFSFITYMFLNR